MALAHDLGHTPFGHAGEDALAKAMAPFGGFDHNAQTLRILTQLEHRYAEFDGLNLTWETLEGVVKHNGPLVEAPLCQGGGDEALPAAIRDYVAVHDLELHTYAGAEAQVASLSDDVAYNNHDIDDGLRAGLFEPEDLDEVPLVGPVFREVGRRYPDLERTRLIHEAVRRLIDAMVGDLIAETRRRLDAAHPASAQEVRELGAPVVAFSDQMSANDKALKSFLHDHMYRHERVNEMTGEARRVVGALFERLLAEPACLPPEWRVRAEGPETPATARLVADFIAGMTDRFAFAEHERLFGPSDIKI
jgi:dGTPase